MKLKLLKRWVFPDYPRSLKIKETYYPKGGSISKAQTLMLTAGELSWITFRGKQYLADKSGTRIIKPTKGTPLNGQALYSGNINEFDRAKLVKKLKEYFGELIATPQSFPLFLRCTFVCPKNQIGDLDNARWFYEKVFIDALKSRGTKIAKNGDITYLHYKGRPLPDDSVKYLSTLLQQWYESEQMVLVFELFERHDTDTDKNKLFAEIFEQTGLTC